MAAKLTLQMVVTGGAGGPVVWLDVNNVLLLIAFDQRIQRWHEPRHHDVEEQHRKWHDANPLPRSLRRGHALLLAFVRISDCLALRIDRDLVGVSRSAGDCHRRYFEAIRRLFLSSCYVGLRKPEAAGAFALAMTGPGLFSLDELFGLEPFWNPAIALAAIAIGIAGALVNLAVRRPTPGSHAV